MKFAVIVFPGSNCDDDMIHVLGDVFRQDAVKVWHKDRALPAGTDCVVLPGGFSYGDYLRSGAIARFSPIMQATTEFANAGGLTFGICNGFQILCEAGLLPGVLLPNQEQRFICKNIYLKTITRRSPLTRGLDLRQPLKIPVAHADGRFFADEATLQRLETNDQILFKYCDEHGRLTESANINGSARHIAGICNERRNVFGMMPHPERASEAALGNIDGRLLFEALIASVAAPVTAQPAG